jgi:uncharacterized protein GlcG (DUF336 family)
MLTLEESNVIIEQALLKAKEMNLPPLSIVVLDEGGHLKNMRRQDGARFFLAQIAFGKAWGAVAMGRSTRELGNRFSDRPYFLNALVNLADGKFVTVPGGVLISKNGQIVGAVGVSGASSDEDEACAIAGIEAAGYEAGI